MVTLASSRTRTLKYLDSSIIEQNPVGKISLRGKDFSSHSPSSDQNICNNLFWVFWPFSPSTIPPLEDFTTAKTRPIISKRLSTITHSYISSYRLKTNYQAHVFLAAVKLLASIKQTGDNQTHRSIISQRIGVT